MISFVHNVAHAKVRIDFIRRGEINGLTSYFDSKLYNKHGLDLDQPFTREAWALLFSHYDHRLAERYFDDMLVLLDDKTRNSLLGKDCLPTIRYLFPSI